MAMSNEQLSTGSDSGTGCTELVKHILGNPSDAEIEDRYLACARVIMRGQKQAIRKN